MSTLRLEYQYVNQDTFLFGLALWPTGNLIFDICTVLNFGSDKKWKPFCVERSQYRILQNISVQRSPVSRIKSLRIKFTKFRPLVLLIIVKLKADQYKNLWDDTEGQVVGQIPFLLTFNPPQIRKQNGPRLNPELRGETGD